MYVHKRRHWKARGDYDQNDGVAGVVYILDNPALAENLYKIGCTRHSGKKRAEDLNKAATTGMPGTYRCVYQAKTQDCGRAEKLVFQRLGKFRRGKWGQEFFEVDIAYAKHVVGECCKTVGKARAPTRTRKISNWGQAMARGDSPLMQKLVILEARKRLSFDPAKYFNLNVVSAAVIAVSLAVVAAFAIFGPYQG